MTKAAAIHNFFNSFGIPAYPTDEVPDDTIFPWITYEPVIGNYYGQQTVFPSVNVYYRDTSNVAINAKIDEISKAIGNGIVIDCDDGKIGIYLSGPWDKLTDQADSAIKRKYTTLQMTFYTF